MDIKNIISSLSKEELAAIIDDSYTYNQVLNKLGISATPYTIKLLKEKLDIFKLDASHFKHTIKSKIWDKGKNEFKEIIETSNSYSEALRRLGLEVTGGNLRTVKDRIILENVKVDKILLNNLSTRKRKRLPLSEILVKNSPMTSTKSLKERLIKEGILKNECKCCGIGPEWRGKKLSLELDHIDGDNRNNEIQNLRILCPNCHSQTETFGGKNIDRNKEDRVYYCLDCHKEVFKGSTTCKSCADSKRRKTDRPTKEELELLILSKPFTQIASHYKVSDNAVRKWCKSYDLPSTKKEIDLYIKSLEQVS